MQPVALNAHIPRQTHSIRCRAVVRIPLTWGQGPRGQRLRRSRPTWSSMRHQNWNRASAPNTARAVIKASGCMGTSSQRRTTHAAHGHRVSKSRARRNAGNSRGAGARTSKHHGLAVTVTVAVVVAFGDRDQSHTVRPIASIPNSEMDRIARRSAPNHCLGTSPSHRSRKQQRDQRTDAKGASETGVRFPVPQAGGESDNRKARDSKGPAPGSFGPARRGQARLEKQSAPRHPSPSGEDRPSRRTETSEPVRRGQSPIDRNRKASPARTITNTPQPKSQSGQDRLEARRASQ